MVFVLLYGQEVYVVKIVSCDIDITLICAYCLLCLFTLLGVDGDRHFLRLQVLPFVL